MFEAIAHLFTRPEDETHPDWEPRLAVAALLVHLAAVDGSVEPAERAAIANALETHYGLAPDELDRLTAEARRQDAEAVDFYRFTAMLSRLELSERLEIIRMMWEVVFADKQNHELEDNMVWRIAELIGVSARDRTVLRSRVRKAGGGD